MQLVGLICKGIDATQAINELKKKTCGSVEHRRYSRSMYTP